MVQHKKKKKKVGLDFLSTLYISTNKISAYNIHPIHTRIHYLPFFFYVISAFCSCFNYFLLSIFIFIVVSFSKTKWLVLLVYTNKICVLHVIAQKYDMISFFFFSLIKKFTGTILLSLNFYKLRNLKKKL